MTILNANDVDVGLAIEADDVKNPKVFISYQWDHQEEAIRVRQFLEEVRH